MYEDDANPHCKVCGGSGIENQWFANDKEKKVGSDWSYCLSCFPGSSCIYEYDDCPSWRRINFSELTELLNNGYKEDS